jgi:glyoxylase-like metal-dependent hydrolase (beta-lactamase superfamily II)
VGGIWKIGAVTVTRIEEQLGPTAVAPEKYFRGYEPEVMQRHLSWLVPNHYLPDRDRVVSSVHSWLIRTPRHTILLDCCAGNHKPRPWTPRFDQLNTPFLKRLKAAGASPGDIDLVLCTHLHADHIGWNTVLRDGRWVPTFPNAVYLFSRAENAFWDMRQNPAMADDPRRQGYEDSVLPVLQAGQAVIVDGGHDLDDGLSIEPAPGHTPGHFFVKLAQESGRALFCGDAIHHAIQVYAPHWNHAADERPEEAQVTRRRMLEHCASQGALLFPTHFGAPHVVSIRDQAGGFALEFTPAAP